VGVKGLTLHCRVRSVDANVLLEGTFKHPDVPVSARDAVR